MNFKKLNLKIVKFSVFGGIEIIKFTKMNSYTQQEVELTEVTINQEVFDFMNINNDLITENIDSTMDVESVISENKINNMRDSPVLKAAHLDKSDLVTKNSNNIKTIVKTEVNTDDTTLTNFRALSLNEVIDLWSQLSKIPTPECKCRSKLKKQKK